MNGALSVVRSELILGSENSAKTARAEALASAWLARAPEHRAVYISTAQAWDAEMRERLARRRAEAGPARLLTVETAVELAHAMGRHGRTDTLIVVDCLTLWLTATLAPAAGEGTAGAGETEHVQVTRFAEALGACAGPLVLISNELADAPAAPGRDARAFLEALGSLNQAAASVCERVTLMAGGAALLLKGQA